MHHASNDPDPATNGMTCSGCGHALDEDWRYCPYCSRAVASADADPGAAEPADFQPLKAPVSRSRRRRSRKPAYLRKRVVLPTIALFCVLAILVGLVYRAGSMLSTVQEISTPPPVVTDNTWQEETVGFATPAAPITVDTGPAREALDNAYRERDLPSPSDDGSGSRLRDLSGGVQDIAGGAAVASGLKESGGEGFTLLVMGVDARPGAAIDIGVRPDVLMLVRFNPVAKSCQMLSIPRDTRVQLPGYGQSKINHALMVGGIPYQVLVTEDFTGVRVDHYMLVDFVAFGQMVDELGGVSVTVPEDLVKNGEVRFTKGTHRFNGEDALAYARFRTASGEGDLDRIERQWEMLSSLASAAKGHDLVGDVNSLLPTVEEHIRTDLSITDMAVLARTYGRSCLGISEDSVGMLRGTRVEFEDPIIDQVLYYNVISPVSVQTHIDELIGETSDGASDVDGAGRWLAGLVLDARVRTEGRG